MEFAFEHPTPSSAFGATHNHPYSSSLASSASSSSSSVFSIDGASSQGSTCSTSSSVSSNLHVVWETDAADRSSSASCASSKASALKQQETVLPQEERLNPRRTSRSAQDSRPACPAAGPARPPSLIRQVDRKNLFVEGLVDCSAQIVEVIWPTSAVPHLRNEAGGKGVLPLKTFIQETLRRSRTSYSTLQVALYYLILIQPHVPKCDFTMEQAQDSQSFRALQCGRRMFLSALILASKYLQDRNYSSRAWSKISGLNSHEINMNEMTFLFAINWKLHISESVFSKWTDLVLKMTNSPSSPSFPGTASCSSRKQAWASVLPHLTPDLSCVHLDLQHQEPLSPMRTPPSTSPPPMSAMSTNTTPTPANPYAAAPPPPRVLEPSTHPTPPPTTLPPLSRMVPLPTPQLTPQSMGFSTPLSRRSSLGQALEFAACSRATSPPPSRRCSPTRSAPFQNVLCQKRGSSLLTRDVSMSGMSGDVNVFMGHGVLSSGSSGRSNSNGEVDYRRRSTSSSLASTESIVLGRGGILEDSKMVLSPITMADDARPTLTPPKLGNENGRKRRCCGEEARMGRRVRPGPGMWKGIL